MIEIHVNGELKTVPIIMTVADLLTHLDINSKAIAVERNGVIVAKEKRTSCELSAGDQIEIVTLVGGG